MKGRDSRGRLKKGYKLTRRGATKIQRVKRRNDGWRLYFLG